MNNLKTILFFAFVFGGLALAFDAGAQTEIQQQLEGVSSTLDTVGTQLASVKDKGLVQTVWDNITAPFAAIWQQITGILDQIGAILGLIK